MLRAFLLGLGFLCFLVFVDAQFSEWYSIDSSDCPYDIKGVEHLLNAALFDLGWDKGMIEVDRLALRKDDLTEGIVIGHTYDSVYYDFGIRGMKTKNDSGEEGFGIEGIRFPRFSRDPLNDLEKLVEQKNTGVTPQQESDVKGDARQVNSENSELNPRGTEECEDNEAGTFQEYTE